MKMKMKINEKIEKYINDAVIFFPTLYKVKIKKIEETYIIYKTRQLLLTSTYKTHKLLIDDINDIYLKKQILNYLRKKKFKNII
jgi:hypothetical protein